MPSMEKDYPQLNIFSVNKSVSKENGTKLDFINVKCTIRKLVCKFRPHLHRYRNNHQFKMHHSQNFVQIQALFAPMS